MEQFIAKIRKVGNSFGVIIPKIVITKMELCENEERCFLISNDKVKQLEVHTETE